MKTKTTYISDDGKEFDTQAECFAWEETKDLQSHAMRSGSEFGLDPDVFLLFLADILKDYRLVPR